VRLVEVQVQNFRNILDSSPVPIESDVTCLVGKNESGKTAFLHALYRLNPARPNAPLSVPDQYPAWLEKQHRQQGAKLEAVTPIKALFELEKADIDALDAQFGKGIIKSKRITVSREYGGKRLFGFEAVEAKGVEHAAKLASKLPAAIRTDARKKGSFKALDAFIERLGGKDDQASKAASAALRDARRKVAGEGSFAQAVVDALHKRVPRFFYFGDYSRLPGRVRIRELLEADPEKLGDDDLTARALLSLAASEQEYLVNPDYERRKRELENVANLLTKEVLGYWSQNPELRVQIDISQKTESDPQGRKAVVDELHVRLWDERHWLSLPFDERSSGFRWFFSFLAAFSEYEHRSESLVILLDEPALALHARAQKDFLRFIDERLAPKHQVIYTTHSPFMVEPGKLERVRLVEDRGREHGAKLSADVLTTDPDTLFPLQGALGYDMARPDTGAAHLSEP
jgi:hypothetical protein